MPVWPICFCSSWPMPAPPSRLPNVRMPMSFMLTPASASADRVACDARSRPSSSGCFPNLVMLMPRIHAFSAMGFSNPLVADGLVAEADGLDAVVVRSDRECGEPQLHAELDVLGGGVGVDHIGAQ